MIIKRVCWLILNKNIFIWCSAFIRTPEILKMEAVSFSETLVFIYESTICYNPEKNKIEILWL
jgi:hypothetical protein